ncbi:hypothetical protein HMPREF3150_06253 [Pseudomonas aeruginosa]|nr:hypothetical protein HMPREF3150_06253 [Pseudomonas aeruginosa]
MVPQRVALSDAWRWIACCATASSESRPSVRERPPGGCFSSRAAGRPITLVEERRKPARCENP